MAKVELDFSILKGKLECIIYYNEFNEHKSLNEEMAIEAVKKVLNKIEYMKNPSFKEGNLMLELPYEHMDIVLKNYKDFTDIPEFSKLFQKVRPIKVTKNMPKKTKLQRSNKFTKKPLIFLLVAIASFSVAAMVHASNTDTTKEPVTIVETTEANKSDLNNYIDDIITESEEITEEESTTYSNTTTIIVNSSDRRDTPKAVTAKDKYWDIINKYCDMYGICPDVLLAIATQERGVHSSTRDSSGAIGLMQIEVGVWNNSSINVYNVQTKQYEKLDITEEKLGDLDFNIRTACAIYQSCYKAMKGNLFATIQCYNMGLGNMDKILETYAKQNNTTVNNVLEDIEDLGWLDDRNIINAGDGEYIEHILSYSNLDNVSEYYGISQSVFTKINGVKSIKV